MNHTHVDKSAEPETAGAPPADPDGGLGGWSGILGLGAYDSWNCVMTFLYIAAFVLLYRRPRWESVLRHLAPVGRMALTSYVLQSVIGGLVFFGYGLGLLGKVGSTATLGIGIAVFGSQIWLCRWWLARFHYGPLEWAWRCLTLLRVQPLSKP